MGFPSETEHDPTASPESAAYAVALTRLRRGQRRLRVGQLLSWSVVALGAALMPVCWQHGGPLGPGGRSTPGNPGYGPLFLGLWIGLPLAFGCWSREREIASWIALLVGPDRLPAITCAVIGYESPPSRGLPTILVPLDDPDRRVTFAPAWPAHGPDLVAHSQVEVFTSNATAAISIAVDLSRNVAVVGNAGRLRPVRMFLPDGSVRASRSVGSSAAGSA